MSLSRDDLIDGIARMTASEAGELAVAAQQRFKVDPVNLKSPEGPVDNPIAIWLALQPNSGCCE